MIDPAQSLSFSPVAAGAVDAIDVGERVVRRIAWGLVLALHGVLAWMFVHLVGPRLAQLPAALQVVWIEQSRTPDVPPMPRAPPRPQSVATRALQHVERNAQTSAVESVTPAQSSSPVVEGDGAAILFRLDGAPLTPDPAPVAKAWSGTERILRDRVTRLPGQTDAAYAETVRVRLRARMTPEQVIGAVVNFLFGAPQPDDCRVIGERLRASDDDVVREIDLHKFRKFCAS